MRVLVIHEDFHNDQHILKPLFERLFRSVGRPRVRILVRRDPLLAGARLRARSRQWLSSPARRGGRSVHRTGIARMGPAPCAPGRSAAPVRGAGQTAGVGPAPGKGDYFAAAGAFASGRATPSLRRTPPPPRRLDSPANPSHTILATGIADRRYCTSESILGLFYAIMKSMISKVLFQILHWMMRFEKCFIIPFVDPQNGKLNLSEYGLFKYNNQTVKFHIRAENEYFSPATGAPKPWCTERIKMANSPRLPVHLFRNMYSPQSPKRYSNPLEKKQLLETDGYRRLGDAPAHNISLGMPPTLNNNAGKNKYLWVLDERGISYCIEKQIPSTGNVPKHTNLTAGGVAYLGGELWFISEMNLIISGGSGRYPPINQYQLEHAAQVFRYFGYDATSLGWDMETDSANRHRKG